jgi:hypothetical protein
MKGRRQFLAGSAACVAHLAFAKHGFAQATSEVSGEYYDWQKTMRPESPWLHDYTQTFQTGLFLCQRNGQGLVKKVYYTFEDALGVIQKMDNLTVGIPKIVIIVGWQFNGHDSRYPSWSVVNERLKRPQDKTALESLKWLMASAKKYNTIVSLHINMFDAYSDSPLWKEYDENNIILKDVHGEPIKGFFYDEMQSYQISYAQEWKTGYAQKRIEGLLRMLPELQEAGVIHIDAFKSIQGVRPSDPISSPYLGYTIDDEIAAQRKILRYWRSKGIDVSTEYAANTIDPDPFVGLQTGSNCIEIDNLLEFDWYHKPANFMGFPLSLFTAPPCSHQPEKKADWRGIDFADFLKDFCNRILPWYYRNNPLPKEEGFSFSPDYYGDVFLPAFWRPSTIIAYSNYGNWDYSKNSKITKARTWHLPKSWGHGTGVRLSTITTDGLKPLHHVPVNNGAIEFLLKAGDCVTVERDA